MICSGHWNLRADGVWLTIYDHGIVINGICIYDDIILFKLSIQA